ncbi:MAG: DUF6056 family protein [Dysgonomonas sp.]
MVKVNSWIQELKDNKKQCIFFGLFLLIFFCLVFILNKLYPLYADDWGYIYSGKSFTEAASYSFKKLYHQYFAWGGRTVVHAIAHLLSWLGVGISDLINSLVFVFLLYVIYRISNKGNRVNSLLFLFIGLYLWLAMPAFSSTVLWLVGAANYMWGALIVILFLSAYYSCYMGGKEKKGWLYVIFFLLAGVISGWTNENMFVAQVFFIVCLLFLLRKERVSIPAWAIAGLIGVCIGGLFMIAAPGNYIRSEVIKTNLDLVDTSLIKLIYYRVMKVGYRYVLYILPSVVIYFAIFYFYRKYAVSINKQKVLFGSLLFLVSGHLACFAMLASYIFPPRAIFGIMVFIVTAIGILCANLNIETFKMKKIKAIVLSALIILFVINYTIDYKNINYLSEEFSKRELYLQEQKQLGNKYIIFKGNVSMPSRYDIWDLSNDPFNWLNQGYSNYYGVDSVKVVNE